MVMGFVFTHCLPRQTRFVDGFRGQFRQHKVEGEMVGFALDEVGLLRATSSHVRGNLKQHEGNSCSDVDGNPNQPGVELFGLSSAIRKKEGQAGEAETPSTTPGSQSSG